MEYLREVQEVPVIRVDVSKRGTIVFTVDSPNDVESILPHFTYSRKQVINNSKRIETKSSSSAHNYLQILVRLVQRISLTLYPMADTKTADHVRLALKAMSITVVQVHEPDRATKTIRVELGTQDDAIFVKEHGVHMRPQNVCPLYILLCQPQT